MGTSPVYHTVVSRRTHIGHTSERQNVKGLGVWVPLR